MPKKTRHEEIAHERQQRLAGLLVVVNLGVGAISAAFLFETDWQMGLSTNEWITFGAIVAISWLNLLIAAGAVGWLWDAVLTALPEGHSATPPPDGWLLERGRMVFYYVGVWANLLALAYIIETTGGLAESPFVPLLIAFVLTGQQLSRFRTQSGLIYLSGLVAIGLMIAGESLFTEPAEVAPHEMTIAIAALAVTAGGLLNYIEKPPNYMLEKHVKQPSRARVYQDGRGVWRVVLLERIHRQDPVVFMSAVGVAEQVKDGYPTGLKEEFQTYIESMGKVAGWRQLKATWPSRCTTSFIVQLSPEQEDE